jgi:hypothetical protein
VCLLLRDQRDRVQGFEGLLHDTRGDLRAATLRHPFSQLIAERSGFRLAGIFPGSDRARTMSEARVLTGEGDRPLVERGRQQITERTSDEIA